MVIKIPVGSIGIKMLDIINFPSLARRGHNPFVYWTDCYNKVEQVKT